MKKGDKVTLVDGREAKIVRVLPEERPKRADQQRAMTAAPQNPLVERVARSCARWGNEKKLAFPDFEALPEAEKAAYRDQAQAALDACQAEAMLAALKSAHAHVSELRDAWQRGAISEHDGQGGTRSNRNADIEVQLRELIAKLEAPHAV